MPWLPGARVVTVMELVPDASATEPSTVVPSLKVTEPVSAGPLLFVTVAVHRTAVPTVAVPTLNAKAVTVLAWVICSLTVFEVPLMLAVSPAYCADKVWVRTLRAVVLHWATPELLSASVARAVAPS